MTNTALNTTPVDFGQGICAGFTRSIDTGGGVQNFSELFDNTSRRADTSPAETEPTAVTRRRQLAWHTRMRDTCWLHQVHGHTVVHAEAGNADLLLPQIEPSSELPAADAMWSTTPGLLLCIRTADCVPVLLSLNGEVVGAAHAGWQGLAEQRGQGVLSALVACMLDQRSATAANLRAWVGPCICRFHYEVGEDVWRHFDRWPQCLSEHKDPAKRYLDLRGLAAAQLRALGVLDIALDPACTWADEQLFSHRQHTKLNTAQGRFVSYIGLQP